MKTLTIILVLLLLAAVVLAAIAAWRFGRRSYQRYSGLETQRAAAKQSRDASVDRLKEAERELVHAQRDLIANGRHQDAQTIEHLRVRLTTATDRNRFALHGYAPLTDPNPIREPELAELQAHDAGAVTDAELVRALAARASATAADGTAPELGSLEEAIDHVVASLDRRKSLT